MSESHTTPATTGPHPAHRHRLPKARRSFAAQLFGYDIFISFALGHLPRGTQSYASDLARQLRERDFAVFYSEDEAAPGEELDQTLRAALLRSRILVVIANRGTLEAPRWVRTEVEEFRKNHPRRPIVPISIAGALNDQTLLDAVKPWLDVGQTIWIDDSQDAVEHGIVSPATLQRLSLAPSQMRAAQWWRITVAAVIVSLLALTASSIWSEHRARQHAEEARLAAIEARAAEERARAELRTSTGLRLRAESSAMLAGLRAEPDERAMLQLLAALALGSPGRPLDPEAEGDLLAGLRHERHLVRLVSTPQALLAMAVAPNAERLITVSDDQTLQLWNARTATRLGPAQPAHDETVRSIAWSQDGHRVVTGSTDTTLRLWDVTGDELTPALAVPLIGHTDAVRAAAFSPDGKRIASGSDDKTAMLWDVATSKAIGAPLGGHNDAVTAVAFSPDGRLLVTASNDTTLRLWDARSGQPIGKPLTGHTDSVRCIAFSPDGKRLVSGAWDNTLILWDVARRKAVGPPLSGHDGLVRSVAYSRDGSQIVSAGDDGSLRLWDARSGAPIGEPLTGHRDAATSARFVRDDNDRIASIGLDGSLRLWNPRTTSPVGAPLVEGGDVPVSLAVSPDGKRLAAGGEDRRLHLWRVSASQAAARQADDTDGDAGDVRGEIALPPWPAPTISVAFSADGARFAAGGYDGTLRLLDGRSGEAALGAIAAHERPVSALAWSPDGKRIATGSWDSTVRIWNVADGSPAGPPLTGHQAWIAALAWSPDGRTLASASADRSLRHWNATTGKLIGQPMLGHENWVLAVVFSPDGGQIVSGSADNSLRRWDAATGEARGESMNGHRRWVTSVDVSPDGRHIVSGSWDRSLRLWRADSGVPVGGALDGHADPVQRVAFRKSGLLLHSAGRSGALHLWAAPLHWPDILCAKLTHNMSASQWKHWVSADIAYARQCPNLPEAAD